MRIIARKVKPIDGGVVLASDKAVTEYIIPFLPQTKRQFPLSDINGEPYLDGEGKQILSEPLVMGVWQRQASIMQSRIMCLPVVTEVQAGQFLSEQSDTVGELTKSCSFYWWTIDLDPDFVEGKTFEDVREATKGMLPEDFLKEGMLKLAEGVDPKSAKKQKILVETAEHSVFPNPELFHNPHGAITFRIKDGRRSGPQAKAQQDKDYRTVVGADNYAQIQVERNRPEATTASDEQQQNRGPLIVPEWEAMPYGQEFMRQILTRFAHFPESEVDAQTKEDLKLIFTPIRFGGYVERTINAPSLVAERKSQSNPGPSTVKSSGDTRRKAMEALIANRDAIANDEVVTLDDDTASELLTNPPDSGSNPEA